MAAAALGALRARAAGLPRAARGAPAAAAAAAARARGGGGEGAPPGATPVADLRDDFLTGDSAAWLEAVASTTPSWGAYLQALEQRGGATLSREYALSRGEAPSTLREVQAIRATQLVHSFQTAGHLQAKLDPLELHQRTAPPELELEYHGLGAGDAVVPPIEGGGTREVPLGQLMAGLQATYCGKCGYEFAHITRRDRREWLRARIEAPLARALAAGLHPDEDVAGAVRAARRLPPADRKHLLDRLAWSSNFESFLENKYGAAKRFGLEGAENLVPGMKAMIDRAAELGVESVILGMPHRGRLNVLANVLRKPLEQIFCEFSGQNFPAGSTCQARRNPLNGAGGDEPDTSEFVGSGDVKYHLGTSYDRPTVSGRSIRISLLANPSHLEAVAPVVQGKTRAKQFFSGDDQRERVMSVMLHGDGSHSGQGVVYETYDLSALPSYTVGGSIHIVVNNQVAFTTDPYSSRSSEYCTDVAKALDAPIFHVNGDSAEAVVRVMKLAVEYRQQFKSDAVIDLVCYRRYGHNEIDEPMFTQPMMYRAVKQHPSPLAVYSQRLIEEGTISSQEKKEIDEKVYNILQSEFEAAKTYVPKTGDWLESVWSGFKGPDQLARIKDTGVPMEVLKEVGAAITALPPGLSPHKNVKKMYRNWQKALETEQGVDWAMAEALAIGTLLYEGNHVRLSGQDVERGTFTQRHAVIHDQKTGERYVPLSACSEPGKPETQLTICNSALSEYGTLGFEVGYSQENPNSLVIWEAQFGDFANCAQAVFDQFISAGEAKWLRQSGLVVALPHGYDGQGPEHSSARIERFLQMSLEDPFEIAPEALEPETQQFFEGRHLGTQVQNTNWQVVYPTTPAQYFHVLRRQVHREFRKPLILFTSKMLLRHPQAKDSLTHYDDDIDNDDLGHVRFKRLIMDSAVKDRSAFPPTENGVKKVLFCSGQVYYKVRAERDKAGLGEEIHMVRVEQLAPFPFDLVLRELRRYPLAERVWLQEEPKNMGPYLHVMPRFDACVRALGGEPPGVMAYAGRPVASSPATGFAAQHLAEERALAAAALALP